MYLWHVALLSQVVLGIRSDLDPGFGNQKAYHLSFINGAGCKSSERPSEDFSFLIFPSNHIPGPSNCVHH
jgi:hypothetical protein